MVIGDCSRYRAPPVRQSPFHLKTVSIAVYDAGAPGVNCCGMNLREVGRNIQQLWENEPVALVLLLLGFMVFLFIVVDAWRLKRRSKRPR